MTYFKCFHAFNHIFVFFFIDTFLRDVDYGKQLRIITIIISKTACNANDVTVVGCQPPELHAIQGAN